MTTQQLKTSKLHKFEDVAAGHDGVLVNETGDILVKPCTPAEIAFYEETVAAHPDFAVLMPTFMGTLQLGKTQQLEKVIEAAQNGPSPAIVLPDLTESMASQDPEPPMVDPTALRGKALDTGLAVVLENLLSGFVKPSILDIKLGQRLWDDDAPSAKRQRLDKVAEETTSASLGFRVAGMKVFIDGHYKVFDKIYGRGMTPETIHQAFETFFDLEDQNSFADVLPGAIEAVDEIYRCISSKESRMYSSSLLFVYEGDRAARRRAVMAMLNDQGLSEQAVNNVNGTGTESDGTEDSDGDETLPKLFDVRVIDFAHAKWVPGAGPDENMLRGIRSVLDVLRRRLA